MNKTITINLGGIPFTIDEEAYLVLKKYLDTLREYFSHSDSRDEILQDIETRLAEMFSERMGENKHVVDQQDVDMAIAQLGKPEDYLDDEERQEAAEKQQQRKQKRKRLMRDPDNRIIGGVCAGIGHYFGIEPIWLRLLLVFTFLTFGFGLLLYIILWAIMPKAITSTDKLEMKGEPVNISSIGKTVEEEFENVRNRYKDKRANGKAGNFKGQFASFFEDLFAFLARLVQLIFSALGKVIGAILVLVGSFSLLGLLIVLIAGVSGAMIMGGDSMDSYSVSELSGLFFPESFDGYAAFIGAILVTGIPLIGLLYGGLSLVTRLRNVPRGLGWSLFGTWVLGFILLLYVGISTSDSFSKTASTRTIEPLAFEGDTLYLSVDEESIRDISPNLSKRFNFYFETSTGLVSIDEVQLDVGTSNSDQFQLEIIRSARADSDEKAEERAKEIVYQYDVSNNVLMIQPFLTFHESDKWRSQDIHLRLLVPEGKTIFLSDNTRRIIYDIDNVTNTYDGYMVDHFWTMTSRGLESPDFSIIEEDEEDGLIDLKELDDLDIQIGDKQVKKANISVSKDGVQVEVVE